jgi:hypothetical protein
MRNLEPFLLHIFNRQVEYIIVVHFRDSPSADGTQDFQCGFYQVQLVWDRKKLIHRKRAVQNQ